MSNFRMRKLKKLGLTKSQVKEARKHLSEFVKTHPKGNKEFGIVKSLEKIGVYIKLENGDY